MTLDKQLASIRDNPETHEAWNYFQKSWDYGYGAGTFDSNALCLPEFDDNDELISWRGRVISVPIIEE